MKPFPGAAAALTVLTLAALAAAPAPALARTAGRATGRPVATHVLAFGAGASAGPGETGTVDLAVPAGLVPQRLTGRVAVTGVAEARVTVEVAGHARTTVTARPDGTFSLVVGPDSLDGSRHLEVGVSLPTPGRCSATATPPSVALSGLRLTYTGTETPPRTLSGFLSDAVRHVDVVVPPDADTTTLGAALSAIGALASRVPQGAGFDLVTSTARLVAGPGRRVVLLDPAATSTRYAVGLRRGIATLTLSGSPDSLVASAQALAAPTLATASSARGGAVTLSGRSAGRAATRSLGSLGLGQLALSSAGATSSYVGVPQDAFGGAVRSLRLHLVGVHTTVPDAVEARLDVLVGDALVGSVPLGRETTLDTDVAVPASLVADPTGLQVQLSARTSSTGCAPALPVEVRIDPDQSSVTAALGTDEGVGLRSFPEVLGGDLPVALVGRDDTAFADARAAAPLVVALQRAAAAPLRVRLVDAQTLVDGRSSGLLVGAGTAESDELGAPLRLSSTRTLTDAEQVVTVDSSAPFGALQAMSSHGHDLLLLGGWTPTGGAPAAARLAQDVGAWVAERGWGSTGSGYVLTDGAGHTGVVPVSAVAAQPAVVAGTRRWTWWLAGAVVVLLLVLAARAVAGRRQRRIALLLNAQVKEDEQA